MSCYNLGIRNTYPPCLTHLCRATIWESGIPILPASLIYVVLQSGNPEYLSSLPHSFMSCYNLVIRDTYPPCLTHLCRATIWESGIPILPASLIYVVLQSGNPEYLSSLPHSFMSCYNLGIRNTYPPCLTHLCRATIWESGIPILPASLIYVV